MATKLECEVDVKGVVDMMDHGEERDATVVGDKRMTQRIAISRRRSLRPEPSSRS